MTTPLVDKIIEAVLYEGYILYPYRPSIKNSQRWTFGGLLPRGYCERARSGETWWMRVQCLLVGIGPDTELDICVGGLQLVERRTLEAGQTAAVNNSTAAPQSRHTPLEAQPWQEALPQNIRLTGTKLDQLLAQPQTTSFSLPTETTDEPIVGPNGQPAAIVRRERHAVEGTIEIHADRIAHDAVRLTLRISNDTSTGPDPLDRRRAQLDSLASTHAVLTARNAEFVSMTDPPPDWQTAAAGCQNVGCWPVLVGVRPDRHTVLAAPIILYDYPQIAPESPGTLFDSTEIDEILTLRIMTLTEDEKQAMAALDPRSRALLERVEALRPEQLMQLHGAIREPA